MGSIIVIQTRKGHPEGDEVLKRLMDDGQAFVNAAHDPEQFDTVFVNQFVAQAGMRSKMAEALQNTAKITIPGEKVLAQAAVAAYFQHLITGNPYWKQTYDQPGGWKSLRDSILDKMSSKKRKDYADSRLHTMKSEEFKHIAWKGLVDTLVKANGQEEYDKWKEFVFLIT